MQQLLLLRRQPPPQQWQQCARPLLRPHASCCPCLMLPVAPPPPPPQLQLLPLLGPQMRATAAAWTGRQLRSSDCQQLLLLLLLPAQPRPHPGCPLRLLLHCE
jgi:hypothetical protein